MKSSPKDYLQIKMKITIVHYIYKFQGNVTIAKVVDPPILQPKNVNHFYTANQRVRHLLVILFRPSGSQDCVGSSRTVRKNLVLSLCIDTALEYVWSKMSLRSFYNINFIAWDKKRSYKKRTRDL